MNKVSQLFTLLFITTSISYGVSQNNENEKPSNDDTSKIANKTNTKNKYKIDDMLLDESKKDFDYFLNLYEESGNEIVNRAYTIVDVTKKRNTNFLNKRRRIEAGNEDAYTLNFEYEGNWKSATVKDYVEFIYTINDTDSITKKLLITKNRYEIPLNAKSTINMSLVGEIGSLKKEDSIVSEEKNAELTDENTEETVYGLYPQASTALLSVSDLSSISKADLKIMRNEIFARYGHSFLEGKEMATYFELQPWYENKNVDATNLLTEIEKTNIALIKTLE